MNMFVVDHSTFAAPWWFANIYASLNLRGLNNALYQKYSYSRPVNYCVKDMKCW